MLDFMIWENDTDCLDQHFCFLIFHVDLGAARKWIDPEKLFRELPKSKIFHPKQFISKTSPSIKIKSNKESENLSLPTSMSKFCVDIFHIKLKLN
jgi:hypothetical protein